MADEPQTIRAIHWRELFPFLNLFRAFRIAVHPSKLLLALAALLLIYAGGRGLDRVWPTDHKPLASESSRASAGREFSRRAAERFDEYGPRATDVSQDSGARVGVFALFFHREIVHAERALNSAMSLEGPGAFEGVFAFVVSEPLWLWSNHWVFALLFCTWFLLVWSVVGGAICRIAAVHVARDEKISVRQAVRFSGNKILSFVFAPLIPLLIIFGIGLLLSAVGWVLFHIPWVGPGAAGVLWILALLGGLVMALVLLGTLGGFNLMYPTIAVEGSDSFDAISRSFSYVFARPWRMLWYTAVTLVYGGLCYLFVRIFIHLILLLTWFFVGWWLSRQGATAAGTRYDAIFPLPTFATLTYAPASDVPWDWRFGGWAIAFWNYLLIGLLGAFAISFYFSASTIMYYLMRREVDATELDDVYVEDADDDLADVGPVTGAAVATSVTTVTAAPASVAPVTSAPRDTSKVEPIPGGPAAGFGSTSAPGGGVTGDAGSSPPGGDGAGGVRAYTDPGVENPQAGNPGASPAEGGQPQP